MGRLPHFLLIGAAKTGTSSLHVDLDRHPGIFMSPVKEPSFFSYHPGQELFHGWRQMRARYFGFEEHDDSPRARSLTTLLDKQLTMNFTWESARAWYEDLFAGAAEGQLRGESSTNYTRWPQVADVPARIAKLIPDCKFLYMMRNPVERTYSHYVHRHIKEVFPGEPIQLGFDEFIKADRMCVDSSHYLLQVETFLEHFPRESFLFLLYEEFVSDPNAIVRRVFEFLGVEVQNVLNGKASVVNSAAGHREDLVRDKVFEGLGPARRLGRLVPRPIRDRVREAVVRSPLGQRTKQSYTPPRMSAESRAALVEYFREPNRRLSETLGIDLSAWNT